MVRGRERQKVIRGKEGKINTDERKSETEVREAGDV